MYFEFLYNFCLKYFSFYEELSVILLKMFSDLQENTLYSCQILMKLEFSRQIFREILKRQV